MKTFTQLREETSSYEQHKKRVQKIQKGSEVSFTSAKTGKKVTGTYKGLKQMGGRSYAHVEHGDGATYVPVHQIHESTQLIGEATADDHKKRVQKITKGSKVSFTHATSGKKISGTYQGIKRMGGRSYAHVEHKGGATYVPFRDIHESANMIVENVEDDHSQARSDFTHLISHIGPSSRAKFINHLHSAQEAFDDGYQQDDDNQMYGALGDMEELNNTMKQRTGIDRIEDTHLGKLTQHTDLAHNRAGQDFHEDMLDAIDMKDHAALDNHVNNLHAYIKQHNL